MSGSRELWVVVARVAMLIGSGAALALADPLPHDTPWLGVVVARLVTLIGSGTALAIAFWGVGAVIGRSKHGPSG